jgi:hypothetical protein
MGFSIYCLHLDDGGRYGWRLRVYSEVRNVLPQRAAGTHFVQTVFASNQERLIPTTMKEVNRFETSALLDAMINRRSRRFAPRMTLEGGPLSYRSKLAPKPLSEEEEAALAFAACGILTVTYWILNKGREKDFPDLTKMLDSVTQIGS